MPTYIRPKFNGSSSMPVGLQSEHPRADTSSILHAHKKQQSSTTQYTLDSVSDRSSLDSVEPRPSLSSKFSSDNVNALLTAKKLSVTRAWLQNITSSARLSAGSALARDGQSERPMVISNPSLVLNAHTKANTELGKGARRVAKPLDAFRDAPEPWTSTPRSSEDSMRSFATSSSVRQERALPQLPLRIKTPLPHGDDIEQLVPTPCLPVAASGWTDDSTTLGSSSRSNSPTAETAPKAQATDIPLIVESCASPPASTLRNEGCDKGTPTFHATLLGSAPMYPAHVSDDAKIVSLHIGSRTLCTTIKTITSSPSHLEIFVRNAITVPQNCQLATIVASSSSSTYSQGSLAEDVPHLHSTCKAAAPVIVRASTSPPTALRSSRASVFDDVPSDEGEEEGEESPRWHNIPRGDLLGVPAMRRVSSLVTFGSRSFLDTTPDDEMDDPFKYAKREDFEADAGSQPPSLSTSPDLSDYGPILNIAGRPLDTIAVSAMSLDIMLDRSPEPYEAILHYLREGELPRKLAFTTSFALATALRSFTNSAVHPSKWSSAEGKLPAVASLDAIVSKMDARSRLALLPLLLHPIIAQLEDLRDEARFLGLKTLQSAAQREIELFATLLLQPPSPSPPNNLTVLRRPGHRQYRSEANALGSVGDCDWI